MSARKPDPNEEAARIVSLATGKPDELPANVEAVWDGWAARIHACDERTKTLARAAFEVGVEAGAKLSASELGKRGAKKGGDARASSLTKARRAEIARTAASKRWGARHTGPPPTTRGPFPGA